MKNTKGFTLIEGLLILVIAGLLAGTGWYVWNSKNSTDKSAKNADSANSSTTQASEKQSSSSVNKEYKNEEYGFSFQYPSAWSLTVDLKDIGRGSNEGDVIVTSPNGTKVDFGPNLGGKGGDCLDDQAGDTRTTRTCPTRNILSIEKLASSSSTKPVYFYHASWTDPTSAGGKTHYYIYIGGGDYTPTKTGSELGAFLENWDTVSTRYGALSISVQGKDDTKNNSSDFFNTQEVQEATAVLKSFKLL